MEKAAVLKFSTNTLSCRLLDVRDAGGVCKEEW